MTNTDLLQRDGTTTLSVVYCQITNSNIQAGMCAQTQGQEGCTGCAALTRVCEYCDKNLVDVPIVGMCLLCIQDALAKEKNGKLLSKGSVHCQIMKKKVSVTVCESIQGQAECKGCEAGSRVCEECETNPIHSHKYGLCLFCTLSEFAGEWKPDGVTSVTKKPVGDSAEHKKYTIINWEELTGRAVQVLQGLDVRERSDGSKQKRAVNTRFFVDKLDINLAASRKLMVRLEDLGYLTAPTKVKGAGNHTLRDVLLGYELSPKDNEGSPTSPVPMVRKTREERLYGEAKNLVARHQKANFRLFETKMRIGKATVRRLIGRLEKDGHIGPFLPGIPRDIFLAKPDVPETQIAEIVLPTTKVIGKEHVEALDQVVELVGGDSDLGKRLMEIVNELSAFRSLRTSLRQFLDMYDDD